MTYWSVDKWGMPANQLSRCEPCAVLQLATDAQQQCGNMNTYCLQDLYAASI
jgi:hypothetical protein